MLNRTMATILAIAVTATAMLSLGTAKAQSESATGAATDRCAECHSDPSFMVTDKKLYDYFQSWRASIHGQEGVSCFDCHGGRKEARDKATAHGQHMSASERSSAVSFQNIPSTCGQCHEEFYAAYRGSEHFAHLQQQAQAAQGPNCVTCHGSLNAMKLNVVTVRDTCQQCHNIVSGNRAEIPARAEGLLNDLNAIRGYRRFISRRAVPEEMGAVLGVVDSQLSDLATVWHSFDLDRVEASTETLLSYTGEQRERILRPREKKQGQE